MSDKNPGNVFTTSNLGIAEFIADWLGKQGVEAELIQHLNESAGDGAGLNELSSTLPDAYLEVHIKDANDVERVRQLIIDNQESLLQEAQKRDQTTPEKIAIECEHCSETAVYPGEMQGSVQDCPHCGQYLDVPGGDDEFDWSVVDETISEDELAKDETDEESDAWG